MGRTKLLLLLSLVAACITAPALPPVPPAPPERALRADASRRAERVVIISYDGVGADDLRRYLPSLAPEGYPRLVREGLVAERVIPVTPTLTSPAHVSMATGAPPEKSGIVSNSFHTPGDPPDRWTSGFEAPIAVETLWEAARRKGKRVGTVTFPGLDGNGARRMGDFGLVYTHPVAEPRRIVLRRADFKSHWYPPGWTMPERFKQSYSPVLQATIVWEVERPIATRREIDVLAIDTTNDATENYDEMKVMDGSREIPVDANRWFAITAEIDENGSPHLFGSWSKILTFDSKLTKTVIYWGAISRNVGYPEDFRRAIDREAGFWPSPPDSDMAKDWLEGKGGIDPETYTEQLVRFSRFFTDATRFSVERMEFDLLLAYQPIVDEAEHQFRIVDPRQGAYSEEHRAAGEAVRRAAYGAFDESLVRLFPLLRAGDALVVTGDHGHLPIDTTVSINQILSDWGFVKAKSGRPAPDSPWAAFTSAGVAHIYAFAGAPPEARRDLAQRLTALTTPEGDPVFEMVRMKGPGDHPNTGDIVAITHTRFVLSSSVGARWFAKSNHYGQHGGMNHHAGLHTILAAWGAGVIPGRVGPVRQTEVARYVAELLGIDPPRDAE